MLPIGCTTQIGQMKRIFLSARQFSEVLEKDGENLSDNRESGPR